MLAVHSMNSLHIHSQGPCFITVANDRIAYQRRCAGKIMHQICSSEGQDLNLQPGVETVKAGFSPPISDPSRQCC